MRILSYILLKSAITSVIVPNRCLTNHVSDYYRTIMSETATTPTNRTDLKNTLTKLREQLKCESDRLLGFVDIVSNFETAIESSLNAYVENLISTNLANRIMLRYTTLNRLRIWWTVLPDQTETNAGITEEYLRSYFDQYGYIVSLIVCSQMLGCAVVEYETQQSAEEAFETENAKNNKFKLTWYSDTQMYPRIHYVPNINPDHYDRVQNIIRKHKAARISSLSLRA
ncbi:ORF39 [Helicoverpa SNPV AC53]|nr:ORF39 [Helicoverpa SNPV AC53]AMN15290.2 ORF39 [Helicoverpa SNPV AC53]AMN15428.2 ORF39 [Helicoverpa SNPV AC53]AMN15566.2 ORF39 [Helicoverpa SNPV AC53]AMN15704.2 ORF39 [Helicoverpa SNPV AC53]